MEKSCVDSDPTHLIIVSNLMTHTYLFVSDNWVLSNFTSSTLGCMDLDLAFHVDNLPMLLESSISEEKVNLNRRNNQIV